MVGFRLLEKFNSQNSTINPTLTVPPKQSLKDIVEREGVSTKVEFITTCSAARRNQLLSECLCSVHAKAQDEHFGIVPLEAMAAHKPVIACNSGDPVETIKNGITRFLCDPTPDEFASAMAKLIVDSGKAEVMGEDAWKHAKSSFSTKIFRHNLNQFIMDSVRRKMD